MSIRIRWMLLAIASLIVITYALWRDIRYERTYTGDLRNRIVGARLIEDGRSPYFYKWEKGDPVRYYDPTNCDTFRASVMTSSPFFHRMFYPIADLPQSRISVIWLTLEYLLFAGMTVFAFSQAADPDEKMAVVFLFLIFLLTNAWKKQIYLGQTYILIPSLAMLFFFFVKKTRSVGFAIAAGITATAMILSKANTLFFFLPFLFLLRTYSRSWLMVFFMPFLLAVGWIVANPHERALWKDYKGVISDYTDMSQGHGAVQENEPDPKFPVWEGVNMKAAAAAEKNMPAPIYSENGNFFVIFLLSTHHRLPVAALAVTALIVIGSLLFLYYYYSRNHPMGPQDLARTAIFGFCLYMVSDLFSPVYRHQYYTVQWIFPLLIAAVIFQPSRKRPYLLLVGALLLSCIHLGFLKMENTIGEYLFMASLLVISIIPGPKSPAESAPANL